MSGMKLIVNRKQICALVRAGLTNSECVGLSAYSSNSIRVEDVFQTEDGSEYVIKFADDEKITEQQREG